MTYYNFYGLTETEKLTAENVFLETHYQAEYHAQVLSELWDSDILYNESGNSENYFYFRNS